MTSFVVCDHCGEPIDKGDRIRGYVRVDMTDHTAFQFDVKQPDRVFHRAWDLHRACYSEFIQPNLPGTEAEESG